MAFITPGQVSNIPRKPITIPTEWVRPSDWPAIIDDANKIQMLVSDIGTQSTGTYSSYSINTIFTRTGGTYSVYIDWGDGSAVSQVSATSSTTSHNYNIGGGATCSRGYNTWVITITTDPTVSLTTCALVAPVNLFNAYYLSSGLLEVWHGDTIGLNVNSWQNRFASGAGYATFNNLEYVKMPSTWNGTTLQSTFGTCTSLQKVIMPITMNSCTSMASCFIGCTSLQTLTLPTNCTSLTNMVSTFNGCPSLYSVIFPMTSLAVLSMASCFIGCITIDNLILPNYTATCTWLQTFSNCGSLTNIKIGSFNNGTTQTFQQTFNGCSSMVRCDLTDNPAVRPNFVFNQTFTSNLTIPACQSLANFVFPTCTLITTFANAFQGCSSITTIDMSKCLMSGSAISWSNSFNNCYNLISMSIPASTIGGSPSVPSTFANTFNGCSSLVSVNLSKISYTSLTSMSGMFLSCFNLPSVNFPSGSAAVLTDMTSAFNGCSSLKSVSLPTGLAAVTTMISAFSGCSSIKTLSFPATMSALTTTAFQSTFFTCRELESVTLPTTVNTNGITSLSSTFQNCISLQTITLPTFGTGLTNLTSAFNNTHSLKTITFNGSLTNAAINFTSAFSNSSFSSANFSAFGSSATIINGFGMGGNAPFCATYSFSTRFSRIDINGQGFAGVASQPNGGVRSLRLPAIALTGQWTQTGNPFIDISYTGIGYADLILLFNDLAAQGNVVSKTIDITGCTGAASLTAADRLIITSKGWTITG